MSPTANFLNAVDEPGAEVVPVVTLTLNDGTGSPVFTLHMSTDSLMIGSTFYTGALTDVQPVNAPGSLGANDVSLATSEFTMSLDHSFPFQAPGETIVDLTKQFVWVGGRVTMGLFETSLSLTTDICNTLFLAVVESVEFTETTARVSVRQRVDWNRPISPAVASRDKYLNVPDKNVNAIIPVRLGDRHMLPMRRPWPNPFNNVHPSQAFGGLKQIAPNGPLSVGMGALTSSALLVDAGRGAQVNKAKVVVACHQLSNIQDFANGYGLFMDTGTDLAALIPDPGDIFNTATEAGFYIADNFGVAVKVIRPSSTGKNASVLPSAVADGRALLDAQNEATFATLQSLATGKGYVGLLVPPQQNLGKVIELGFALWALIPTGANTMNVSASDGTGSLFSITLPTDPAPRVHVAVGSVTRWPGPDTLIELQNLSSAGTPDCRIYAVALLVRYAPTQQQIEDGKVITTTKTVQRKRIPGERPRHGEGYATYTIKETLPPTSEIVGRFYANTGGYPDDASGTFSGVANGKVSRPSDLIHLVLRTFGGEVAGRIQTDSAFGGMVAARAALKNFRGRDMSVGMDIVDDTDVGTVLSRLMSASMSWCFLSPWDNKWKLVPQYKGMPTTYTKKIRKDWLTSHVRVNQLPASRLITNVRMPFAYDDYSNTFKSEASIGPTTSVSGRDFFNIRHESLDVQLNTNDTLDFKMGNSGVQGSFVLTAQENTYDSLCADLKRMSTTSFLGRKWAFGFGGCIATGSYKMSFTVNGAERVFVIPFGTYTMEQLASMCQAFLAPFGNILVTYSRTTRKFSWAIPVGVTLAFFATSANQTDDYACTHFGLLFQSTGTFTNTTVQSDYPVEERFFSITTGAGFHWLINTGPFGTSVAAPRTACQVLGFELGQDLIGNTSLLTPQFFTGCCPKGFREKAVRDMERRYIRTGATTASRRATVLDGKAVNDSDTAVETVSRLVDMFSKGGIEVSFSARNIIGIERGMVFEVAPDFDIIQPYPDVDTDGSWVGKRFMVTETEQRQSESAFDTQLVAIAV